jgi:hypothetical protein
MNISVNIKTHILHKYLSCRLIQRKVLCIFSILYHVFRFFLVSETTINFVNEICTCVLCILKRERLCSLKEDTSVVVKRQVMSDKRCILFQTHHVKLKVL